MDPETEVTDLEISEAEPTDDLDALLAQYVAETQEVEAPEPDEPDDPSLQNEVGQLRQWAESIEGERFRNQELADVSAAVDRIRGELEEVAGQVPDKRVRDYLYAEWLSNPDFRTAWENRQANPEFYRHFEGQAVKALQGEATSRIDLEVTANMEAVRASVRSGSRGGGDDFPSSRQVARMSDSDFTAFKQNLLGRA